ncbi:MAG: lysylphosphatidylglycerol synthase transmembrane domain-containing protein [Candidatus Binatia bacterium]
MTRALRTLASIGLSAVFLYFAVRGLSWNEIRESLAQARWGWVVASFVPALASLAFRALRWGVFVRPLAPVATMSLVSATAVGFAANMVLPLRAGEVIRPWMLSQKERISFTHAFATVALERLFDMATLVVFFAVAMATLPLPDDWRGYGRAFFATFVVFLVAIVTFVVAPKRVIGLLETLLRPLPEGIRKRVLDVTGQFAGGLAGLGSMGAVLVAAAWSLAIWAGIALSFGLCFFAFGLDVPFVEGSITVAAMVAIAVSIPGGPGFIGTFQFGCVVALGIYGVPGAAAVSYSFASHASQAASSILAGLYFFLREGLTIRDVAGAAGKDARSSG